MAVAEGRVEFVDLRIQPALLEGFIQCLVDDVAEERAKESIAAAANRWGVEPDDIESVE